MAFKKGEFQSAAMRFKANPGVPIYPGVYLNEIGASLGVHPLTFGGSLGAKIAELLELELAFKYREETKTELGFFGGEGKLSLRGDKYRHARGRRLFRRLRRRPGGVQSALPI